jgi:hypothetical protein
MITQFTSVVASRKLAASRVLGCRLAVGRRAQKVGTGRGGGAAPTLGKSAEGAEGSSLSAPAYRDARPSIDSAAPTCVYRASE